MTNSRLKIAIVGAGPAGLTLARLLFLSPVDVDVSVYELDASPTSRPGQGGTLDLHPGTGLAAIEKSGLWDSFRKYARFDDVQMVITDKHATKLISLGGGEAGKEGGPHQRPEIDRGNLREILLESVPSEWIKWGHHLREVTEDGMLIFDGGKTKGEGPFDLIVGADGAWSKVRNRLHAVKPAYSGVSGYAMKIKDSAKTCPQIDRMVGEGAYSAMSEGRWISAQRLGDGSLEIRNWFLCAEGEAKERLDKVGKQAVREHLLQIQHDWAPEVTDFLREADVDSLKQWTLYELPVGSRWQHKKGFTLIGDAASLATPFSGEGVNKAMTDSLELAACIEKIASLGGDETTSLDKAVLEYEEMMFPRAQKMQAETMANKLTAFGPGGPSALLVSFFTRMANESDSWPVRMLGTAPFVAAFTSYFWIRIQLGWAVRRFWRRL